MQIPHNTLDPETLRRVLSEIVTRDGTDYGAVERSTADKVDAALRELEAGAAQLHWDQKTETASLVSSDQVQDTHADLRRLRGATNAVESNSPGTPIENNQEFVDD